MGNRVSRCEDAPGSPASAPSDVPPSNGAVPELARAAEEQLRQAKGLQYPGEFEQFNAAASNPLMIDPFDGFRLQFHRPLNEKFMLTHTIMMGNTMQLNGVPGGALYQFSAHAQRGEDTICTGIVDMNGVVRGELRNALGSRSSLRISGQFEQTGEQNHLAIDYDLKGSDFSANLKCENGAIFGGAFVHAVTPSIAVGTQLFYQAESGSSVLHYATRYQSKNWVICAKQGMRAWDLSYHRKVNDRTTLAATLTTNPTTLESSTRLGAQFMLKQSRMLCQIDGTGKITSTLECMPMMGIRLALSGEMHHASDHYKFGYGLSIGQ